MRWLRNLRRDRQRARKSRQEAAAELRRLQDQRPEVDQLETELNRRRRQNNFRRLVQESLYRGGGGDAADRRGATS